MSHIYIYKNILSKYFVYFCCRQALLAQRGGGDSDKLNPTHVTSSRAPSHLDQRSRNDVLIDDDDKLLDVVGPPQSPLMPLGHSLSQMHAHPHSGKLIFLLSVIINMKILLKIPIENTKLIILLFFYLNSMV